MDIKKEVVEEMRGRIDMLWNEETRLNNQKRSINQRLVEIEKEKMEVYI